MYNNVPPQLWMQLDKNIRKHLAEIFSIPRSGITEVVDQEVVRDGYSVDDLKAITVEKMTEYIGSEQTFPTAWEMTCAKAKLAVYPPISIKPMADEPIEKEEVIETKTQINVTKKSK